METAHDLHDPRRRQDKMETASEVHVPWRTQESTIRGERVAILMSPPRCMETTTHVYHAPLILDHDSEDDTASCAGSSYMAPRAELTQLDASGEDEKSIRHSV